MGVDKGSSPVGTKKYSKALFSKVILQAYNIQSRITFP
jgi:hypothetical protein